MQQCEDAMHSPSHLPLPSCPEGLNRLRRNTVLIVTCFGLLFSSFYLCHLGVGQMRSLLDGLVLGDGMDDPLRQQPAMSLSVRLARTADLRPQVSVEERALLALLVGE